MIADQNIQDARLAAVISRAQTIFADQLQKYGVPRGNVTDARVAITRPSLDTINGDINGHATPGAAFLFSATATMRTGKSYLCQRQLFVAPHNAAFELQSGP